ncbi:MAG TPA: hypothetical protein VKY92_21150 [Verrucomicrobiae bacterium]|nr:hypothetical protein [Verrucomicrobiae bacterium]
MRASFQWANARGLGLCLAAFVFSAATVWSADVRDLYSDTWVGHDALGRNVPPLSVVGPVKNDHRRVVGIFYITWHSDSLHKLKSPYAADVSRVLSANPAARLDSNDPLWTEGSYHWGEPEAGYFLSRDEYVIRKDMSMLADASVDVVIMDVTNAVRYWDEWETIFSVMDRMRAEGNKVPQFCFWAFNGPVITVVQDLYEKIYKAQKHKELWFMWDGKPLLLYNATPAVDANGKGPPNPNPHYEALARTDPKNPHFGDPAYTQEFYDDYTPEVKGFFTLRSMWWGYWEWAGKRFVGTEDNWSFGLDLGDKRVAGLSPGELVSRHNGRKEEAAVTPAQHPSSLIGKSWTREKGEPPLNRFDLPESAFVPWMGSKVDHPEGYGIYFQQRWDEAIAGDPEFLYLNDWNEWTAGKYSPPGGGTTRFMNRDSHYFFVDQYNAEFNRTIQPMKGGYTDNYYMQMVENIRRYKGVRPIPELVGLHSVKIDGRFNDWSGIDLEYRDTIGDTFHRDYDGYGGLHYTNNTGRNDIVSSKVAVDRRNAYFYVETREPLTPHTGSNWMLLLIDADLNPSTGWYGYDYLINWRVIDETQTTLSRFVPGSPAGRWLELARLKYQYAGNTLEMAVPLKLLGLKGDHFSFDFHWCDNPVNLDDPISLCTSGDSAPNRRFNYRCNWKWKP